MHNLAEHREAPPYQTERRPSTKRLRLSKMSFENELRSSTEQIPWSIELRLSTERLAVLSRASVMCREAPESPERRPSTERLPLSRQSCGRCFPYLRVSVGQAPRDFPCCVKRQPSTDTAPLDRSSTVAAPLVSL